MASSSSRPPTKGSGGRNVARSRAAREALERAAGARRRVRALVGAGAAVAVLVTVGVVWVATGDDDRPESSATATCAWNVVPAEARAKEVVDVDAPPTTGVPRTGPATMTITTDRGVIRVALDRAKTPCAVASFAHLAGRKFFDGTSCHRLTAGPLFALQCGDPSGTGWGGPAYRYVDENLPVDRRPPYPKGVLAMANAGPNTNQSQFYLVYADTNVDPESPVIGEITEGLPLLEAIAGAGHDNAFERNADGTAGAGGGRPKQPVKILSLTLG